MMKTWDEMTRREQLAATHYDYYKDVHGIRPRWFNYEAMSEEDLERELDLLAEEDKLVTQRQQEAEQQAIVAFEARIQSLIETGAGDRATAIRWIYEAEGTVDDEYLCYLCGLPYGYFNSNS